VLDKKRNERRGTIQHSIERGNGEIEKRGLKNCKKREGGGCCPF
jgi:hypothetical protein